MSTHAVNVVEIEKVMPHPNADRLELTEIGGWQVVIRKGDFKPGDRGIYIEPDYVIPTNRPEFSFLAKPGKDQHRLKAVRLRGELSFGLLIPVPDHLDSPQIGANVMDDLGITRYEPPAERVGTHADELAHDRWPDTYAPKFDIESLKNFPYILYDNEQVVVTEKVHGANARYTWMNGEFFMGSRNRWVKPDASHIWSRAVADNPAIIEWCKAHEGCVLYGEVFGGVQGLKYGLGNSVRFVGFAAVDNGRWFNQLILFATLVAFGIPHAPVIYTGPFNMETIRELAEQDSVVSLEPGHMMEGVVVVPVTERFNANIGRVALKHISNRYWESNAD